MRDPIALLEEIQHLMELRGENPFKIRAFGKAAHALAGREDLLERAQNGTLSELPSVGKGIAEVLSVYLLTGQSPLREELLREIPPGLAEFSRVPGLGPKKAARVVEELGISTLGELEYACRENRLSHLKGFGLALQQKILEGLLFMRSNEGLKKLSDVLPWAQEFLKALQAAFPQSRVSETGALRRRLEVLSELDFLVELTSVGGSQVTELEVQQEDVQKRVDRLVQDFLAQTKLQFPVRVFLAPASQFGYELARTTATPQHWDALLHGAVGFNGAETAELAWGGLGHLRESPTEEAFYQSLGLRVIPPEARETGEEVEFARSGALDHLLPLDGVLGVFHNHTTRSDGAATLEQMVVAALERGYQYIGISDHSQSAFYAQGLKEKDLWEQKKEILELQKKYPKIRIFWGIESDILADGQLDYPDSVLAEFDFVIASVHSRLNMDGEAMTNRLIQAIRNPYTRFLGHPTGRLLLGRKGYELNMPAIIQEAARCGVAIELNANPHRLDLDWRWGAEMRKHKTLTSIHPDAHEVAGLDDVQWGVWMARKALFPRELVVNAQSASQVEQWLKRNPGPVL
ncbi:MAG: PHP domain-containing protein [Bdellovibrionia bacterium]